MEIRSDEIGWMIDTPCAKCGSLDCNGSSHCWIPNKIGNTVDGLDNVEDAIKEVKEIGKLLSQLCDKM